MLHEEEVALRRALHASLASKTASDEDLKPVKTNQSDKEASSVEESLATLKQRQAKSSNGSTETKAKSKRKSDESVDNSDRKRQKKLLVKIKPKSKKEKLGTNGVSKNLVRKKVGKSKIFLQKKKMTVNENDGKIIKRRRKRKNIDAMKEDGNDKSTERLNIIKISLTEFRTF